MLLVLAHQLHVIGGELALKYKVPWVSATTYVPLAGGLLSYGIDNALNHRRAAYYIDKILKGANPAELPVEPPTKVELTINLKTAKALGMPVPADMRAHADKIIE